MSTPEHKSADTQTTTSQEQHQQVDYEKRFKDTQVAFTKSQQELSETKKKLELLEELVQPPLTIDDQTQKELDDLKYSDPDAWRVKMNSLEQAARDSHKAKLESVSKEVAIQAELERRAALLEQYNKSNPTNPITEEVIKYDIPPRITAKLEQGAISFDEYLNEVHNYLYAPKVVGNGQTTPSQPNLGEFGGGITPTKGATDKSIVANYKNLIY